MALALILTHLPERSRHDYDEALVHAKTAVNLSPEKGNRFTTLALAEYRVGHWTESLAASERSMSMQNGGNAFNWFLMALAACQQGEMDKARGCFDKAVAWMRKHNLSIPILRQLWTEAAELLGQPGPDATGPDSSVAPEEKLC